MDRSPPRAPWITVAAAVVAIGGGRGVWGQCAVQKLTAEIPIEGDQFGDSVAVSGDVAVIGASRHDGQGSASGTAYVFRYARDESGISRWTQEAQLFAPNGAPNDLFGWSVAVDGTMPDGETIVVGAYLDDNEGGQNAGAAYVYRSAFDGTSWSWSLDQRLVADDGAEGDQFAEAVALRGEIIVIGAPRDDEAETNVGSAYVFRDGGAGWNLEAKLVAGDGVAQDLFGTSVSVDGEVILVGAAFTDQDGQNAGAAYPFRRTGQSWVADPRLTADDATAGDKFGQSVAVRGDLALVGAFLDDEGAPNTGSAYVFRYDGVWSQTAKLTAIDAMMDDQFGRAVAVLEGPDGEEVALVGAALVDDAGSASGAAYLFRFDGVDWIEDAKLEAADAEPNDTFGVSVALDERFVIVGANKDDDAFAGANTGGAYLFTTGIEVLVDCNGNGQPDFCDIAGGDSEDCNGNGVPDECDLDEPGADDNGNGVLDECEDCNGNGIPDPCDIDEGREEDCNENGIPDSCDIAEGRSEDIDQDGVPDECFLDCNGNGVDDREDILSGTSADCNGNEIPDECDLDDGTSADCNDNGIPDECDIASGASDDCDGGGVPDECEDCNENGFGDLCDIAEGRSMDLNGDGIPDECQDCDGNGVPDFVDIAFDPDLDCDGNEVIDACEIEGGGICDQDCRPDCNGNGVLDTCDVTSGDSDDCDANGVPDECDEDCNANGVPDACDIAGGESQDANGNGIPDECEDCNDNGLPDEQDISGGTSADCNANGIPDECEIPVERGEGFFCTENCDPDCNANGVPDACDIDGGGSVDFNENGVPDECEPDCDGDGLPDFLEILLGLEEDCQGNGVPDSCDIAEGTSNDADGDGVPDECQGTACPADLTGDGTVDFADVLAVLMAWGACAECPEDLTGDGMVDFADVLVVLTAWGVCPGG